MIDLDAYCRRIGYTGARAPTLATLRALQVHHPRAIPFENLNTLTGVPVRLDLASLESKLVRSARGGYCFEQNTLFAHVLEALGFGVTALAARVVWERPAGEVRARSHMVLLVEAAEGRFFCDVGFGGLTPTAPLRVEVDVEQPTPHETFRVVAVGAELAVEASVHGAWKRLYRFDLQRQEPVDIEVANFYVMGHADSPMIGRLVAARAEPDRRYALRNGSLAIHHSGGESETRQLGSVAELRDVLRSVFAIEAPPGAAVDGALARVLD